MIIISSIVVAIAWLASLISIWTDLAGYTEHIGLFGRTGAVLTLCGVVLEYKISTKGQHETTYLPDGPVSMRGLAKATLLTEGEKKLKYFAHITVIVGTLIWGFGDLLPRLAS